MILSKSFQSVAIIAAFLVALASMAEEDGLRPVFMDDFSESIAAWTLFNETADVTMSWDPTDGSPAPGSLTLTLNERPSGVAGSVALGPCMDASPGEEWRIDAMVKRKGIGNCVVFVAKYTAPGCMGERSGTGNSPFFEQDVWHARASGGPVFGTTRSVRAGLLQHVTPELSKMTCHFDSVVLTTNRAVPTDVPTLSSTGLLLLVSALVAAAVVLLARRSTDRGGAHLHGRRR